MLSVNQIDYNQQANALQKSEDVFNTGRTQLSPDRTQQMLEFLFSVVLFHDRRNRIMKCDPKHVLVASPIYRIDFV